MSGYAALTRPRELRYPDLQRLNVIQNLADGSIVSMLLPAIRMFLRLKN